ncbi:MAG: AMP-binding protein [Eubacterium sp.]|nr:AMP-binding protein [Eubacterium sp.]
MPKRWATEYADRIAVATQEEEYTYLEMAGRIQKLANGLYHLGIRKGDHVIVQLPNTMAFIDVFFALERIGAYPVLTLPAHRRADLEEIFRLVSPTAYIVPESYLGYRYEEMARDMRQRFPSIQYLICDGEMEESISLDTLYRQEEENYEMPSYDDMAHLLLSGGSTGTPKLIPRGHGEYLYNAQMAAKRCRVTKEDVLLVTVPISHNFSLSAFGILGAFMNGAKVVLCPYPSADEMLPLIEEQEVTALQLVPALVASLLDMLTWEDAYDISSLRVLLVGGAVFEKELALRVEKELPCKLIQVFGTAEGIICMTSLEDSYEVSASCQGTPISKYDEIRIVDENLDDVKQGEFGEFIERGPYTIHEYYKASKEVNEAAFTPSGFYRTGDKAKIDEHGNLLVAGRIKEQINKGGEKIMPIEVEEHLCRAQVIKSASVVGVPDEVMGHRICAFVVADAPVSLSMARGLLKESGLPEYKMPDDVFMLEDFPLTKLGKIDKTALQELAEQKVGAQHGL